MLGSRIQELRQGSGVTLAELASRSGLCIEELERLEKGHIESLPGEKLWAICDGLRLRRATDLGNLLNLNTRPRQFQCLRSGLLQTGSNSIRLMFSKNYDSRLEYMCDESCAQIDRFLKNEITEEEFASFVLARDCSGHLELDSAFFIYYFQDILVEHFPSSKVIFNIRDCYSWLNCMLNFILNHRLANRRFNGSIMFGVQECFVTSKADLVQRLPELLDPMLSFWDVENKRILAGLPPGRSLIVRTHEISEKVDEIAGFLEVPPDTLDRDLCLRFPREKDHRVLHDVDYHFLRTRCQDLCGGLMAEFFPGYSLDDFLGGDYLTSLAIYRDEE